MLRIASRRRFFTFWISVVLIVVVIVVGSLVLMLRHHYQKVAEYNSSVTIILSPHYDDAVLSLGGLLAQESHPTVVATFFTGTTNATTTNHWDQISGFDNNHEATQARMIENEKALGLFNVTIHDYNYPDYQYGRTESDADMEQEIAQDIQALIASFDGKKINIFGPAYFNSKINHADHVLLHEAFLDVARDYPNSNVTFYMYEDLPYTIAFNKTSVISLQKNLENESGLLVDPQQILLTAQDMNAQTKSLEQYPSQIKAFNSFKENVIQEVQNFSSTRCGIDPKQACEVVYEIAKY